MANLIRRRLIAGSAGGILLSLSPIAAADSPRILGIRIWPGKTYTRLTLETTSAIRYKYFALDNPNRLVIDLEGMLLNEVVRGIAKKVQSSDPYIRNIRAGQKDSKTVRIVIDLKQAVRPQVFPLDPVAQFKHRLVADLYPRTAAQAQSSDDPLMAFLNGRLDDAAGQPDAAQEQQPSAAKSSKKRVPVVMLDPGHGGEDPGAISKNGLREKDIVLTIARETKKRLEHMGYKVHMTRNEDIFIPLQGRVQRARRAKADLFVSIHADSFTNPTARGTGVFVLSQQGASSESAKFLAQTQNQADLIGGIKTVGDKAVDNVILDLVQTQTNNDSMRLGRLVLNQLGKNNKLHRGQVEQANFAVLRAAEIPSILVETAFLSNPEEEALLASPDFQKKTAEAIALGIKQYLNAAVLASR